LIFISRVESILRELMQISISSGLGMRRARPPEGGSSGFFTCTPHKKPCTPLKKCGVPLIKPCAPLLATRYPPSPPCAPLPQRGPPPTYSRPPHFGLGHPLMALGSSLRASRAPLCASGSPSKNALPPAQKVGPARRCGPRAGVKPARSRLYVAGVAVLVALPERLKRAAMSRRRPSRPEPLPKTFNKA